MENYQINPKIRRLLLKPLLNLFSGESNSKSFKVTIDELLLNNKNNMNSISINDIIFTAMNKLSTEVLDRY